MCPIVPPMYNCPPCGKISSLETPKQMLLALSNRRSSLLATVVVWSRETEEPYEKELSLGLILISINRTLRARNQNLVGLGHSAM